VSLPAADLPSYIQASTWSSSKHLVHSATASTPFFVNAHGSGLSFSEAIVPAIAEALERYCATIYTEEDFVIARAADIESDCLDLDSIAAVSPTEMANPKCRIKMASKEEAIRWVRGVSLTDRRSILIPAVMVYTSLSPLLSGERFWFPISTGCAAHTDLETAIRSAIFEVAERESISLTWLQQFALPQIIVDQVPDELAAYMECYRRASADMEFRFYDATTDLGIPTVYGVRIAPHSATSHTVVACSASSTITAAIAKVMLDLVSIGSAFDPPASVPSSIDDFCQIMHGATFMARKENAHAFEFLLGGNRSIPLSDDGLATMDDWSLDDILESLAKKNISVYAVDLTTDEAKRVGMKVIRVIVPQLQPLSFSYRAQFRGTPRLYSAPVEMGYDAHDEHNLNRWPQPFA
jgi:ribosomal protein S12 methylthiotransferase accessory factor